MKRYKVCGGIGNILDTVGFFVCDSLEEAEEIGKKHAMALYQDCEGDCDMMSWEDCKNQMIALGIDYSEEKVDEYYKDVMSCWLVYSASEY